MITSDIHVLKDAKEDIQFWLAALKTNNLTPDNVKLINRCLERELSIYIDPLLKYENLIEPSRENILTKK